MLRAIRIFIFVFFFFSQTPLFVSAQLNQGYDPTQQTIIHSQANSSQEMMSSFRLKDDELIVVQYEEKSLLHKAMTLSGLEDKFQSTKRVQVDTSINESEQSFSLLQTASKFFQKVLGGLINDSFWAIRSATTVFSKPNSIDEDSAEFESPAHLDPLYEGTTSNIEVPFVSPTPLPEFILPTDAAKTNDGCYGVHNSEKKYTVATGAKLLAGMLSKGPGGMLSQFKCHDPHNAYIPQSARDIYKLSPTWKPIKSFLTKRITNNYVQCTAFVFMSYQIAGKPIEKKGRTNAADFLSAKYSGTLGQFKKYQNGHTREMMQEGDIVVWSPAVTGTSTGHVGIVIEVREDSQESNSKKRFGTIRVANANSSRAVHEYRYEVGDRNLVKLKKVSKDWAKVPDYWLRKKEVINSD